MFYRDICLEELRRIMRKLSTVGVANEEERESIWRKGYREEKVFYKNTAAYRSVAK
jgi:hypothetical protein